MKKIEAIVRPEKVQEVRVALDRAGWSGLTIEEVEGHGKQKGITQQWRGESYQIELLPKFRIEVVVPDSEVEKIIEVICKAAKTGSVGDGKIFVLEVLDAVRIRTDERGEAVL
ncbi:MAG: P-II family nitrogen regulator [Candidatus Omnitrophica bacterium]|nr:P-II family nitrogen regulator [Candidatus Omnitrophota bacterium]